MIEKHQQANGIGRGKITINPEYIKRAGEITVGGLPIKVLSSNPNTGRVLAQFPDGHIEEVKAAPDYFIRGNTYTKELKNNLPVYGETNTAANERADSLDEAHDLTPIFSNLITAGQISTMNEGALDLLNGKYLEGTTKLFSPAMFGSGIGGVAARSVIGGYNLFNKNGVRKTYNLFNLGHYGEGALSLLGDTFNVAMATEGLGSISNALKGTSGYRNWRLSNAINKGVKENAVITAYNRNPAVKDIGNLWDYQSYLDNVFPNSKVKDVLWHGSRSKNLETFDTNMIGSNMPIKNSVGMYLAPERNTVVGYGTRGGVYPVLLNTETPFITNQFFGGISKNGVNVTKISPKVRSTLLANSDAVIAPKRGEIAFFNPDNALILGSGADVTGFRRFMSNRKITAENAANITPEITHFYHGSPVRFNNFSADFIGSGEGGSKVMRGINLWPPEKIGNAPKFANIKSPDAPLHLGVSSTPLGGELNPTVYDVSGRGLKLYTASPREVKGLSQSDLISQGYDGIQTPNQVTVFPESIGKLSIDKQSTIEDFIRAHPEVERWATWTTDNQKMQNIIDMSRMSKWTPEQWTAAQDAAIARGDMAEAQRLRDLHFKISAPKTEVVDINGNPQLVVHKTPETFTVFDNNSSIGKLNWFATPNAYGENGVFATGAGKNPRTMKLYVNMRNAHKPTIDEGMEPAYINQGEDGILGIVDKDMTNYFKSSHDAGKGFMMSGGVDNPNALKSADAVTYDNNGVRIPLGERDNFNINDIRYGLLPFGIGLTGYGLYKRKLGGKMNILEFLKNGSGIYIKPKNRGKFTKYCHGKVTNECILKGKNSSNPTIRKRAIFADNARRWKHEEGGRLDDKKKGGFVKGINVLDSNPTAYKYVKKKYKMAQQGTKLTFGLKVSNVGNWINNNLDIVNTAVNGITGLISANKKSRVADQFAKAKEAEMKSFKEKTWKEKYMENLLAQEDRSDVVNMSRAYNQTYGDVAQAVQEKLLEIDSQIAAAQLKAAQALGNAQAQEAALGNAWGGILKGAGEIAMNALASNGIPKSKTSPTSLTGLKTSSFGGMNTPQFTSPQTNYSFLK